MSNNIILSIHPQYAKLIENGSKIYEVRTRKANISKGTIRHYLRQLLVHMLN